MDNDSSEAVAVNLPYFRPKIKGSGKINPRKEDYRRNKDVVDPALRWAEAILEVRPGWAQTLGDGEIQEVWRETKGKGVRVAILDTGVEDAHPALRHVIDDIANFTNTDSTEDRDGHGTHCAGIVAAREAEGVPFQGIAPEARLLIGKVLNDEGRGSPQWIADGITWAIRNGVDIISLSLSGPPSPALFDAVHQALWLRKFVICAAGNDGSMRQNGIGFPGRFGGVITVAAHDEYGNPSGFTSRGGEIDVIGPGTDIWSTWPGAKYKRLSGTSMATPFVAGLAALIVAKHQRDRGKNQTPIENNEDLKEHLLRMAAHPGYHDNASGYGPLWPLRYFVA